MARKRKWPRYFRIRPRAGGRDTYEWEPAKSLREAGWTTLALGDDLGKAIIDCKTRNRELDAWRAGVRSAANDIAPAAPTWTTMGDLIDAYQTQILPNRRPSTRREYKSRLKWIRRWAENGTIKVRDIDRDMVETLRDTLVDHASPFTAAGILRVLSALFTFAEKRKVIARGANPCSKLEVPTPPSRAKRCTQDVVHALVAIADEIGMEDIGTGIALGFYTTQREADLLQATRFHYVAAQDMAPQDRAELAGSDGEVRGLRLQQNKTGQHVIAFLPPWLRTRLDAQLTARDTTNHSCTHIIRYPETVEGRGVGAEDRPCPDWKFRRCYLMILTTALERAVDGGNNWLVDQLTGLQFRDLRRSGMCWMRDLGVGVAQIAAISGHSITYTQKILDTYLPGDPRAAAAGLAMALRNQAAADLRTKENEA